MKSIISLVLLLFIIPLHTKAAIVEPAVGLVSTSTQQITQNTARFIITFDVEAPLDHDVYIDRSESSLRPDLYFNPGNGLRWELMSGPGSPPLTGSTVTRKFELVSPQESGSTSSLWKISAGEAATLRFTFTISTNPFEPNQPQRFLAIQLTHLNWGVEDDVEAPYFALFGEEFHSEYAAMGPIPEPSAYLLTLLGICSVLSRRYRRANHI